MNGFWILIASNALVAMVLAVLVTVIARVWRNPAVLHLLWILVLVKLFAPPLVDIPIAGLSGQTVVEKSKAGASPVVMDMSEDMSDLDVGAVQVAPVGDIEPASEPLVPAVRPSGCVSWEAVVIAVWLLGAIVAAAVSAWRAVVFSRLLQRHATNVPETVRATAERLCGQIGLQRCPNIKMLRAKIPPLVWLASGRARIVLPTGLLESLDRPAWEAVILHELAHVKRKDGLVRWLEIAATTVFWWHPVVWWARRELRAVEEQCCDAMVVRAMPRMAKDYAAALVDTLDFLSTPSRVALPAGTTPWQTTRLARRITMLRHSQVSRVTFRGLIVVAAMIAAPMVVTLAAGPDKREKPKPPSAEKAELMGRVAWFFANNFRDVTAAKPIEWGEPVKHKNGNVSIRYQYEATIWGREVKIMNQVFTFDRDGKYVRYKNVKGFPKAKVKRKFDTSTKNGMIELVQDFFTKNFRDITSRNTIEWGEPVKHKAGNVSIRYKYEATIWGKDVKVINQVFTFAPDGKFVDVKSVKDPPKNTLKDEEVITIHLDKDGKINLGDKKVNEEQLFIELKQFATVLRKGKKSTALIKWDSRGPEKNVELVCKLCMKAGVTHFGILPVDVGAPAKGYRLPASEAGAKSKKTDVNQKPLDVSRLMEDYQRKGLRKIKLGDLKKTTKEMESGAVKVSLDKNGNISFDDNKVTEDELANKLNQFTANTLKNGMVIVQADRRCTHQKVKQVIDLCRKAGITPIAISLHGPTSHPTSPAKKHLLPAGKAPYGTR